MIIGFIGGLVLGIVITYKVVKKSMCEQLRKLQQLSDKHLAIMNLFSMWLQNKEAGLKIEDYLKEQQIKRIAIYGMSFVGERLYDELEQSDIKVVYCIDKNANNIYKDINVLTPDSELEKEESVDAIVVTAFVFFDEIEANLKKKVNVPILSIDDIVYSL